LTNGEPEPNIDEARGSEILAEEDLEILIDLGVKGGEGAKYWTCDFSHVSCVGRVCGIRLIRVFGTGIRVNQRGLQIIGITSGRTAYKESRE
jgi:hypothetical protein